MWRGEVVRGRARAIWIDASGIDAGRLPDIPVNALAIDPRVPSTIFAGTDIGVFVTADDCRTWTRFGEGLPNCAVFDLRLHRALPLLRAATHGRGLWERSLEKDATPSVDLYVRNNVMDTGRLDVTGVESAFADSLRHVALGDRVWWWQCADIKVDTPEGAIPSYQMPLAKVDYVAFESKLADRGTTAGAVNRVFVQVHNRGASDACGVVVKLLSAKATLDIPPLPADFWTAFPGDAADTRHWRPIGAPKVLPTLTPTEPAVVEWDWPTETAASEATCLLAVVDSLEDPIPPENRIFDVAALVQLEKRVGLRSLHPLAMTPGDRLVLPMRFAGSADSDHTVEILQNDVSDDWRVSLFLPSRFGRRVGAERPVGAAWRRAADSLARRVDQCVAGTTDGIDTSRALVLGSGARRALIPVGKVSRRGLEAVLVVDVPPKARKPAVLTFLQRSVSEVIAGATFAITLARD